MIGKKLVAAAVLTAGAYMSSDAAMAAEPVPPESVAPLFAVLLGGNEVSATGAANAGDEDGHGSATVKIRGSILCFALIVDGIDKPIAAHIHEAPAGVNGPVVVPLMPPNAALPPAGSPGTSSRCIRGLDPALLADIRRSPANYYVNIHTDPFPGGAIRGQLF